MTECEACHGRGFKDVELPLTLQKREVCRECRGRGVMSPFLNRYDYQGLLQFEKKRVEVKNAIHR